MTPKLILDGDTPGQCEQVLRYFGFVFRCRRLDGHPPTGHEATAHSYGGSRIHLIWGRPEDDKPCDAASS